MLYLNKLFCTQTKAEVPGSCQNPKLALTRYHCKLQDFFVCARISKSYEYDASHFIARAVITVWSRAIVFPLG